MSNDDASQNSPTNQRIQDALRDLVAAVPKSSRSHSMNPEKDANDAVFSAKCQASVVAGSLALPPGPIGMITIIPDLILIWKIQAQLVADIAAIYGKTTQLKQEAMLYCLFRHGVASLARDVLIRVGERVIIRRAGLRFMQKMLAQVGVRITQKALAKTVSRWIPILGAVGMGGYAWHDTAQVGKSAIELFKRAITLDDKQTDDVPSTA